MRNRGSTSLKKAGFTLLEVMLVLLLMGLAAGYVMFNAFGASKSDLLKTQAFEADKNEYYFVYLDDDDEWQRIEGEKTYEPYTLPEPFTFTLNLDDLPWDVEDRLFDRELFDENLSVSDEGVEIGNEEEKKLPPPQVLIMSSGEITPFTLSFNYEGDDGDNPVYYSLQNQDLPPLVLEGPLERPL